MNGLTPLYMLGQVYLEYGSSLKVIFIKLVHFSLHLIGSRFYNAQL